MTNRESTECFKSNDSPYDNTMDRKKSNEEQGEDREKSTARNNNYDKNENLENNNNEYKNDKSHNNLRMVINNIKRKKRHRLLSGNKK